MVSGCESGSPPVAAPSLETNAANASAVVVASARGSGRVDLTSAGVPPAKFYFSALRYADGSVSGEFRQTLEVGTLISDVVGKVTCLSVDSLNHRAWVGGVILQNRSTHPSWRVDSLHSVGLDVWFRVADYSLVGQADRSTTYGFKHSAGFITSEDYCNGMPWPAADARTFPLSQGSLSVTP
jgi:hypothetical protein